MTDFVRKGRLVKPHHASLFLSLIFLNHVVAWCGVLWLISDFVLQNTKATAKTRRLHLGGQPSENKHSMFKNVSYITLWINQPMMSERVGLWSVDCPFGRLTRNVSWKTSPFGHGLPKLIYCATCPFGHFVHDRVDQVMRICRVFGSSCSAGKANIAFSGQPCSDEDQDV